MSLLINLDQIATGVVEHSNLDSCSLNRFLREPDAQVSKSNELGIKVVDLERRKGYAIFEQRLFQRFHRWIPGVRLQYQLSSINTLRRNQGQPTDVSHGDFGLLHESEYLGVES